MTYTRAQAADRAEASRTTSKAGIWDRFWSKVDTSAGPDNCWPWMACRVADGYGRFGVRKGYVDWAHRVAYMIAVGPIPDGLHLDHLCRNRACVNPSHLEPVTPGENVLRGEGFPAVHAQKTHCPQGHPYSGDNLVFGPQGRRRCRECRRARDGRRYQRRKAEMEMA